MQFDQSDHCTLSRSRHRWTSHVLKTNEQACPSKLTGFQTWWPDSWLWIYVTLPNISILTKIRFHAVEPFMTRFHNFIRMNTSSIKAWIYAQSLFETHFRYLAALACADLLFLVANSLFMWVPIRLLRYAVDDRYLHHAVIKMWKVFPEYFQKCRVRWALVTACIPSQGQGSVCQGEQDHLRWI